MILCNISTVYNEKISAGVWGSDAFSSAGEVSPFVHPATHFPTNLLPNVVELGKSDIENSVEVYSDNFFPFSISFPSGFTGCSSSVPSFLILKKKTLIVSAAIVSAAIDVVRLSLVHA